MSVLVLILAAVLQAQSPAVVELAVSSEAGPVPRAQVIVAGKTVETGLNGHVTVALPPGPHEVRFTYSTHGAATGIGISIASLCLLGALLASEARFLPFQANPSHPAEVDFGD